ncbi:peptide ligase PGM1-related protein [Verrucosispora sp. WMMD573]|uniref:preATP grasp domain-containing protein n=1 Tax=Verrucosispora sp. WMMD573 TaxID=3015149 RepID=UPI00248C8F38|nr:peptide ligase PGM1-related protein [Verrucosispora sp. WMMD573]WBB53718.1 peptide ligase PGM1-related protein [Verrucosispora sp. WMMD573]
MTRLLVGNEFNEDRFAVADAKRKQSGWWTQRLLWQAVDDDILVLPVAPERSYLDYVTGLTGTDSATLRIVVPPVGQLGVGVLSPDRLTDPEFLAEVRAAVGGRTVTEVCWLHPDSSIARLAEAIGAADALPGFAFLAQGGGRLANSKAAFRAVAAGAGVPLPDGGVCTDQATAAALIGDMLDAGHPVILKHDFRTGGRGNEIVAPASGVLPVGAQRVVVIADRPALVTYLASRWDWLTSHGHTPVVVERYHPDHRAVFLEYLITDAGIELAGQGEMLSAPVAIAEVIPAPDLTPTTMAALVDGAERLCESLRALGYRGLLSADSLVTPDGVFFSEYNGRVTGSTHIYGVVGAKLVGPDYADRRVLLERDDWKVPSLEAALAALTRAGLAFDPESGTGVVAVMPHNTSNGTLRYCYVAATLAEAWAGQERVEALLAPVPQ